MYRTFLFEAAGDVQKLSWACWCWIGCLADVNEQWQVRIFADVIIKFSKFFFRFTELGLWVMCQPLVETGFLLHDFDIFKIFIFSLIFKVNDIVRIFPAQFKVAGIECQLHACHPRFKKTCIPGNRFIKVIKAFAQLCLCLCFLCFLHLTQGHFFF